MAMTTSLIPSSNIISILIIVTLFFLFTHSYCLKPSDTFRGLVVAEKTRLGSKPPSCYNKCNQCHPCMAEQVPTMPSHDRVPTTSTQLKTLDYFDSSSAGNRYSNYKPLGWKCRCDDHFYNP